MKISTVSATNPNGQTDLCGYFSSTKYNVDFYLYLGSLTSGKDYVVSAYIKCTSTGTVSIPSQGLSMPVTASWQRIVFKFTANSTDANQFLLQFTNGSYTWWHWQIETGNTVTDWKVSSVELKDGLEDLGSSVTELSTQYSTLTQTVDGFKTEVSKTYATKTALAATTSIASQTADKFTWLVESGTSSSDFTITDRLASLTADNINLNGLVTFTGLSSAVQTSILTGVEVANNIYTTGTTTIDGGKITANSITADKLNVNSLFAQDISMTGSLNCTGTGIDNQGNTYAMQAQLIGGQFKIVNTTVGDERNAYIQGHIMGVNYSSTIYSRLLADRIIFNKGSGFSALYSDSLAINDSGSTYYTGCAVSIITSAESSIVTNKPIYINGSDSLGYSLILGTTSSDAVVRSWGKTIILDNGNVKLSLQADGNLVLYTATGEALWSTGTSVN